MDWIAREPTWMDSLVEFATTVKRGMTRPWATLAVTGVVSLLAFVMLMRPKPYEATAILRLSESDTGERGAVLGKNDLRGWIEGAALSGDALLAIDEKYDLYPSERSLGEAAVREAFRDDLTIEIADNYFLVNRTDGSGLRSARLSLTYQAGERAVAEAVTLDLANRVVSYETAMRKEESKRAIAAVARVSKQASDLVAEKERALASQLAAAEATIPDSDGAARAIATVQAYNLSERIATSRAALASLTTLERQSILRLENDASELSQRVELVHFERPTHRRTLLQVALITVIVALLALPFCSLTTGAFDARLRSADDCLVESAHVYSIPARGRTL